MKRSRDIDLTHFNTFGITSVADQYSCIESETDLLELSPDDDIFILGGGSNILLPSRLHKWVLHNSINYIKSDSTDDSVVLVEVGAGVNWHHFVEVCVAMDWGGVENLALIPGRVGAAPVQNIGAYGVELKDVFERLRAYDRMTGNIVELDGAACEFGYRNSLFKGHGAGRYIITSVLMKLNKKHHTPNVEYYALRQEMHRRKLIDPTIREVFDMVVAIRSEKLPDPKDLGNSGSFFKNPVIDAGTFESLTRRFPEMKYFAIDQHQYKIPAGYLIEQCGWKGKRVGLAGCYEKQALVIVNYGGATVENVMKLIYDIKQSVYDKFGLLLEEEVNIIKSE